VPTFAELRTKFRAVWPLLDERTRRLMAASEAKALGYGGVSLVHRACGLSRKAIRKGIREIEEPDVGVIDLGETHDTAETSIPASCGTGDQPNSIIQEYVCYNTPYFPHGSEFTQTLSDPNFTFAQLNTANFSWAILRSYFISNMDSLEGLSSGFGVNSAYRDPAKEYQVAASFGGRYAPGSRHLHGDAVDVATTHSTWTTHQTDGHQLGACVEPVSYQGGSYADAHLDWRGLATVGPTYTGCPTGWSIGVISQLAWWLSPSACFAGGRRESSRYSFCRT
jgi:hypothetical protein